MMVVVKGGFGIDQVLNVLKLGELTRDSYGALVCKAVLFLRLLQKLNKEWVLQVIHRHRYFLLLFAFTTHLYFHAPFSYLFSHHHHFLYLLLLNLIGLFEAYAQLHKFVKYTVEG